MRNKLVGLAFVSLDNLATEPATDGVEGYLRGSRGHS